MRKGLLLILAMITLLFYTEKSQASFLLEPYAGMMLNSTYEVTTGTGVEGDISGSAVGARVGFTQLGFSAGLNGQRANVTLEPETGTDSDYTFTRMGFFVGYDFPMMLRVWGEYVFSLEGVDDDDTDNKIKEGSGTAIGIGYKVLPFVSVNLEMANMSTTKFESASGEIDYDASFTQYILSVSLPLSI